MSYDDLMKNIRKEIFLTAQSANIAHIASAFSIVETMYVLYEENILKFDCKNPHWEGRDYFILSKGHGSLALYNELYRVGFFDKNVLRSFSKPGSILGGEPCFPNTPGVECSTGSLGHGLSFAVGVALSKKIDNRNERVFCLLGDGECEEGTIWEAVMFAVRHKLDNLTILIDSNKIQKMGTIEEIMGIDSWKKYFETFGCNVEEVDGHNVSNIKECLVKNAIKNKPRVVILNTTKGKGVSIVENNPRWHWKLPSKKELKYFIEELDINEEEIAECKKHI